MSDQENPNQALSLDFGKDFPELEKNAKSERHRKVLQFITFCAFGKNSPCTHPNQGEAFEEDDMTVRVLEIFNESDSHEQRMALLIACEVALQMPQMTVPISTARQIEEAVSSMRSRMLSQIVLRNLPEDTEQV